MIAIDVYANREPAIRIEYELDGRLAPRAAHSARFLDQIVLQQALGDVRDRRRREPGDGGEIDSRDRSVHPDRMQGYPLIVVACPLEIRAGKMRAGVAAVVRRAVVFLIVRHRRLAPRLRQASAAARALSTINFIHFVYSRSLAWPRVHEFFFVYCAVRPDWNRLA